jgi:hypothetical protein
VSGQDAAGTDAEEAAEPQSARQALVAALKVPRYARYALAFAAVFAVGVALFFVGIVSGGVTDFPLVYYPALAFVVFVTAGILALVVLVTRRVLRLAVHPASIVRKSATGGLLAGLLWLAAGVGLGLGPGPVWAPIVDVATPWAALLAPFGLWAVWTRYKRTLPGRPVAAVATLVAVGGALVLADLAAVDLLSLLPDVGEPVDPGTVALFRAGAVGLVGGTAVLAALSAAGEGPTLSLAALAGGAVAGLAGFLALAPGRLALAALAAGLGVGWTVACVQLRHVPEDDVPTAPDADVGPAAT